MKRHSFVALALSLVGSLGTGPANAEPPPSTPVAVSVESPAAVPDRQAQVRSLVAAGKLDVARAGAYRAPSGANVRGQPGTNSPIVGHLPKGTAIAVLGRVPNSWWYAVAIEKSIGYVSAELLAVDPGKAPSFVAAALQSLSPLPDPKPATVLEPDHEVKAIVATAPVQDAKSSVAAKEVPAATPPEQPPAPALVPAPLSFDRLTAPAARPKVPDPRKISMCPVPGIR